MLTRKEKRFGYWLEDQRKDTSKPDAITIILMSHFLGKNITLISGKSEEWSTTADGDTEILIMYNGENKYTPTEVGIYF